MSRVKSRDQFVTQVTNILKDSVRDDEAFVFGISGRWGEGKTTFLESLKYQLKPFPVISVNPWKYAKDDNSFMRAFLRSLSKEADKSRWDRLVRHLKLDWQFVRSSVKYDKRTVWSKYKARNSQRPGFKDKDLDPLYFDSSKHKINKRALLAVLVVAAVSILAYKLVLNPSQQETIRNAKTALTLLLIPLIIGVMQSLTTTQRTNKALSTQDSFEQILNDILAAIPYETVVVFVDDLDRLTAKRAISVLDNLRTFFDNPKLVFVVAGDHTVLERHLGRELRPGESPDEQAEEGRRFLKKIFNVYWRLPLPTKPEFGEYIDSLTDGTNNPFLYEWLKTDEDRELFKAQLLRYFSNNFRNTQRFIDRVIFTFHVIDGQINNDKLSDESKEYFLEMQHNPLLVVRILLFEELANPLYERIVARPELLIKLELAATANGQDSAIDSLLIEDDKQFLTYAQRQFVKSFLFQKPRFRDERGERVKSLQAYIALSSDTSFGDSRGYTPKEFLSHLRAEHYPDLKEVLERSGETKLTEAADTIVPEMERFAEVPPQYEVLKKFVMTIAVLDPELPPFKIFVSKLTELDYTLLETIEQQKRIELVVEIGNALEGKVSQEIVDQLVGKIKVTDEDLSHVNGLPEVATVLTSRIFLAQYEDFSTRNANSAIELTVPYRNKFLGPVLSDILQRNKARLISEFVSDDNDSRRNMRLEFLSILADAKSELEQTVFEQIKQKNPNIWAWVIANIRTESPLFTDARITQALYECVRTDATYEEVKATLNLAINWPSSATVIWNAILEREAEDIFLLLADVYTQSNYGPVAPDNRQANEIVKRIIGKYINEDGFDETMAIRWLDRVNRSYWPFSKIEHIDGSLKTVMANKARSNYLPQSVKDQLTNIKNEVI